MIKVALNGRIGNQLFQYVVCRTLAERKGFNFYVPEPGDEHIGEFVSETHLSDHFDLDYGVLDGVIKQRYTEDLCGMFENKIINVDDFTLLEGYFQTDRYFKEYRNQITKWLKLKRESQANEILQYFKKEEYCFIHLRGGDYKKAEHWLLSKSYYDIAIQKMRVINSNLKFIVISEDFELSSRYFDDFLCLSINFETDFELLKLAKYCIISNSTFAWWASWLSEEQITIAPKNWLNYNKPELGPKPVDIMTDRFIWV